MWKAERLAKSLAYTSSSSKIECDTALGQMQAFLQGLSVEQTFKNSVSHPYLTKLIDADQLMRFKKESHHLTRFKEHPIQFWCTYKRDPNGRFRLWKKNPEATAPKSKAATLLNRMIQSNSKIAPSGHAIVSNNTGRVPGFADRILECNMKGTNYKIEPCIGSDHAPVSMTITHHSDGTKFPNIQQIKIISFNTATAKTAVLNMLNFIKGEKEAAKNKIVHILCVQEIDSNLHKLLTSYKGLNDKVLLHGEISKPLFKWHGFRLGIYCTLPNIIQDTQTKSFKMFHQWNPQAHTKGFMWVDVQVGNCKFVLINAHCPFSKETAESWKKLDEFTQDRFDNGHEAIVMCGDLNSRSDLRDSKGESFSRGSPWCPRTT